MSHWISTQNTKGFAKIVLEEDETVGVYVLVYETANSATPERDHLQDDLAMAKFACEDDYGVPPTSWEPLVTT